MHLYKIVLVALLVALLSYEPASGWWGRRRHRCTPVKCKFTHWHSWGGCNRGVCGTQMRQRYVYVLPKCNGYCPPLTESRTCNIKCLNGGTMQRGRCVCRSSYFGTCCEIYRQPCRQSKGNKKLTAADCIV